MSDKTIEIQIDDQTSRGVYSNNFVISSSPTEFTLDFIYQNYQQNKLQTRVVIHPSKARELLSVLQQQLQKHEEMLKTQQSIN